MADDSAPFVLTQWQREFADSYLESPKARSLLVAPVGTGKTVTALYVAQRMLKHAIVDAILVMSDHRAGRGAAHAREKVRRATGNPAPTAYPSDRGIPPRA